jgi:hypothetical protein
MAWFPQSHWRPTKLLRVAGSANTSTGVTEVLTDAGRAYIKPIGNRQGPHVLATDWVGTHLAHWFGLSTFEIALLELTDDDAFEMPGGSVAGPGPAFAARAVEGEPWGRSKRQLDALVNPEDISRLVVFDTWTLNSDRHHPDSSVRKPNYDNVFLSSHGLKPSQRRLIAMDHGLCFINSGKDLTARLGDIDNVKSDKLFGLFPEFPCRLNSGIIEQSVSRLREISAELAREVVDSVPMQWEVSKEARNAWSELIYRRAGFVADHVSVWIDKAAPRLGAGGD